MGTKLNQQWNGINNCKQDYLQELGLQHWSKQQRTSKCLQTSLTASIDVTMLNDDNTTSHFLDRIPV